MRKIILAVAVWVAVAVPAQAQSRDIEATIDAQIAAFLRGDLAAAFDHASPGIKGRFGTAENFGTMVREGYPMVWNPSAVRHLGLRDEGGRLWQRVAITDAEGRVHVLDYLMVAGDGGWKIDAVVPVRGPEVNA